MLIVSVTKRGNLNQKKLERKARSRRISRYAIRCGRIRVEALNSGGLGKHERVGEGIGILYRLRGHSGCFAILEVLNVAFRPNRSHGTGFRLFLDGACFSTKLMAFHQDGGLDSGTGAQ